MKETKKGFAIWEDDETDTILEFDEEDALILSKELAFGDKVMTIGYIVGFISFIVVLVRNIWLMI